MGDGYKVLTGSHMQDFVDAVRTDMYMGWTPLGGISIAIHPVGGHTIYSQAMIKTNDK